MSQIYDGLFGTILKEYSQSLDIAFLQRHLGRSYNVYIKIFRKDAFDKYIKLLKDYTSSETIEKITDCIVQYDTNKYLNEILEDKIYRWICPNLIAHKKDQEDQDKEYKKIENEINSAIYRVMPDVVDPIFSELKKEFPYAVILQRLHILKLCYLFRQYDNENTDAKQVTIELRNPIGYRDIILIPPKSVDYFPVITMMQLCEDYYEDNLSEIHLPIATEKYLYNYIIKLEQVSQKEMTPEIYAYLVTRLSSYLLIFRRDLDLLKYNLSKSINLIIEIQFSQSDSFFLLSYAEKRKLIEAIPFLVSIKTSKIVYSFIFETLKSELDNNTIRKSFFMSFIAKDIIKYLAPNNIFDKLITKIFKSRLSKFATQDGVLNNEIVNLNVFIPLRDIKGITSILKCAITINNDHLTSSWIIDLKEPKIIYHEADGTRQIWIEINSGFFNPSILSSLETNLEYYLTKTRRDNHIRMSHRTNMFFDAIRNDIESEEMSIRESKYDIIISSALQLSIGSFGIYFNYNSIHDRLEVKKFKITKCLQGIIKDQGIDLEKYLSDRENRLKNYLINWESDDRRRNISAIYKTLDECVVVWDLKQVEGYGKFFSSGIKNNFKGSNNEDIFDNDRISIPILCHNRVLGVLLITSILTNQFSSIDRIRLIYLCQIFGIELFKAKFLNTIQNFEDYSYEAIKTGQSKTVFFDKITNDTAKLLGSKGALLIWRVNDTYYKIIGRAGEKTLSYFGNEYLLHVSSEMIKKTVNNRQINFLMLSGFNEKLGKKFHEKSGYGSCIQIPILLENNLLAGIIILFDGFEINTLSQALKSELKHLAVELRQVISSFLDNEGRIRIMKEIMVHDIQSSLGAAHQRNQELKTQLLSLGLMKEHPTNRISSDIDVHLHTAREMTDYLGGENLKLDLSSTLQTGEHFKFYTDGLKKLFSLKSHEFNQDAQKSSLNDILNNVLHSNISKFKSKKIYFEKVKIPIPKIWVNYPIMTKVISNLVDNVTKYGELNSKYIIETKRNYSEWVIYFKNSGIKLNQEAAANPWLVFSKEYRGYDPNHHEKIPGKGLGMYIASELLRNYGIPLDLEYTERNSFADYSFIMRIPLSLCEEENPWTII